jgi:hypothetical protein
MSMVYNHRSQRKNKHRFGIFGILEFFNAYLTI